MDNTLRHVLEMVVQLYNRNDEFASALKERLNLQQGRRFSGGEASQDEVFAAILRQHHDKCYKKARKFYDKIEDAKLRNDLVHHYSEMLWSKTIFDVSKYFVLVNFQIENMMNYYLSHDNFHEKVAAEPQKYKLELTINEKYKIQVDVNQAAFRNGCKVDPTKIGSLWSKLVFWAVEKGQTEWFINNLSNLNAIISVRNEANHANSSAPKYSTEYWQKMEDESRFTFIENVIKTIRNTLI